MSVPFPSNLLSGSLTLAAFAKNLQGKASVSRRLMAHLQLFFQRALITRGFNFAVDSQQSNLVCLPVQNPQAFGMFPQPIPASVLTNLLFQWVLQEAWEASGENLSRGETFCRLSKTILTTARASSLGRSIYLSMDEAQYGQWKNLLNRQAHFLLNEHQLRLR